MKKNNFNIIKYLLKNKKVNYYTKMIIFLNTLNFYGDNYIPNKKLMNMLNIDKKNTIRLIKQLENDKIISLFYKGRKRYFTFNLGNKDNKENINQIDLFDYNWLEEE